MDLSYTISSSMLTNSLVWSQYKKFIKNIISHDKNSFKIQIIMIKNLFACKVPINKLFDNKLRNIKQQLNTSKASGQPNHNNWTY